MRVWEDHALNVLTITAYPCKIDRPCCSLVVFHAVRKQTHACSSVACAVVQTSITISMKEIGK